VHLQPLELKDKPLFDTIFQRHQPDNSWFSFVNFFIWQDAYHPQWAWEDECLFITLSRNGQFYAAPPFAPDQSRFVAGVELLIDYFASLKLPFHLKGLSTQMTNLLTTSQPHRFAVTPQRDRFDYVYLATDLIGLNGRKYHTKRNHINKFISVNHNWHYVEITDAWLPDCLQIANLWCEQKECSIHPDLEFEHQAIEIALNNFSALGLTGGAIVIGDKLEAFSCGEMLNSEMAVIHIEKANSEIDGLYTMLNHEFCRHAWQQALFINREEDLGLDGLRKAKESYFPIRLVEKHDLTLA
jgi:hypothetical protein